MKKYLGLFLLFMCTNSFALSEIHVTVQPSGGTYTTLSDALTANAQNLITNDKYLNIEILGDWIGSTDTKKCWFSGYDSNKTNYIHIYTSGNSKNDGTNNYVGAGANYYRLGDDGLGKAIEIYNNGNTQYVLVEGIIFVSTCSANSVYCRYTAANSTYTFNQCVFDGRGTGGEMIDNNTDADFIVNVMNCNFLGLNNGSYSTAIRGGTGVTRVYGCGFSAGDIAIRSGGASNVIAKNCFAYLRGAGNHGLFFGTFSAESDYNLSQDATAPGTNSLKSKTLTTSDLLSITNDSENFHVVGVGSQLYHTGMDLFTDSLLAVTTDMENHNLLTSRTSIGADEYIEEEEQVILGWITPSGISISGVQIK